MITIHRTILPVADMAKLTIPGFIRPLHIAKLDDLLQVEMWYEVDAYAPDLPKGMHNVFVHAEGTGHDLSQSLGAMYVNTLIWENDGYNRLVFHFYVGWDR